MKASWKGYLKISLVTIPVKSYNAIKKRDINFNLIHKTCGSRIKQKLFCPVCNREVSTEELVKGYQYGKGMYVIITDEELSKIKEESTDVIEILKFVESDEIHPKFFADSYYLVPDGKIASEAFLLFHKAMTETNKTAIGKAVIRSREHLFAICPHNESLIAYDLHYADEIQSEEEIEELKELKTVKIEKDALEMAKRIIENLSGKFVPEEYKNEYREKLMKLIKAKAEGKEFKLEVKEEKAKVISLMEALKQSLMETEIPKKEQAVAGRRVSVKKKVKNA
ncbi:MAG: Ku protein [Thermodesulfovibrio sp.]|nr:Ku protein [Thermodesulfovibrio sp.]